MPARLSMSFSLAADAYILPRPALNMFSISPLSRGLPCLRLISNLTSNGKSSYPKPSPRVMTVLSQYIFPMVAIGLRGLPIVTCQLPVGSALMNVLCAAVDPTSPAIEPSSSPSLLPKNCLPMSTPPFRTDATSTPPLLLPNMFFKPAVTSLVRDFV